MLDETSAEVLVVFVHSGENVMQRKVITAQTVRIDYNDILFGFSSPGVDFAHALYRAQVEPKTPVEQRLELHQAGGRALQRKLERLTEDACQRTHYWL